MTVFRFKITTIGGTTVDFQIREADLEYSEWSSLFDAAKALYGFELSIYEVESLEITKIEEEL